VGTAPCQNAAQIHLRSLEIIRDDYSHAVIFPVLFEDALGFACEEGDSCALVAQIPAMARPTR
jgi:hypothetical protein